MAKTTLRMTEVLRTGVARLHALSPLAVLDRGYSIAQKEDGTVVIDSSEVDQGDYLKIKVSRGDIMTEVLPKGPKKDREHGDNS